MKKRLFAIFMVACMIFGFSSSAFAAENVARVTLDAKPPDENGYFSVTMTMYDMTFRVYQFALRYDPEVVAPVDADGTMTDKFGAFARLNPSLDCLSTVGTQLDAETGLIDFSGYIMPGTTGAMLDDQSQAVIGSGGMELYRFAFKQLKEGDAGIQVATEEKGAPYRPACPQGVIVANEDGTVPVTVMVQMAQGLGDGDSEQFTGGEESTDGQGTQIGSSTPEPSGSQDGQQAQSGPSTPDDTGTSANELLRQVLMLKIGSHAAVVSGGVTAIYPGERQVTAYIEDDRTYVPIRFVAERLGAVVGWENNTRTVTVAKNGHTVRMAIGSLTYTLDGVQRTMDAPAELVSSRTMVPIRFVTEALGYQVVWDAARGLVVIVPLGVDWSEQGQTELEAMDQALTLMNRYSNFV